MIVWCTGISGSGRGDFLREVGECFRGNGLDCAVFEFGELLARVAEGGLADEATTLLDGNVEVLRARRMAALDALTHRLAERPPGSYSFVSTHACFMRRGRLQPGMDMAPLKQLLEPMVDMYVTVIDGCVPVYGRQQQHSEWRGHLSLAEIAIWRDFETSLTQMLAGYEGKPFYLIARQEPPEALLRLCATPREKTIYLAYPITAILEESPGLIDSALAVGEQLRQAGFVVFNPLSVEDIGEASGTYDIGVPVPEDQFAAARPYIESQIIGLPLRLPRRDQPVPGHSLPGGLRDAGAARDAAGGVAFERHLRASILAAEIHLPDKPYAPPRALLATLVRPDTACSGVAAWRYRRLTR